MKKQFLFLLLLINTCAFAQNVGINNNNPQTALDVNGALRLRSAVLSGLLSGANADVDILTNKASVYTFAAPGGTGTGSITITGFNGGVDGKIISLFNNLATDITLMDENLTIAGGESLAINKISLGSSFSANIKPNGTLTLRYDGGKQRWTVESSHNTSGLVLANAAQWNLTGNAGTNPTNFIGTIDAQPLRFGVNGGSAGIIDSTNSNVGLGVGAMRKLSISKNNVAIGAYSLYGAGNWNPPFNASAYINAIQSVAIGDSALYNIASLEDQPPAGTIGTDEYPNPTRANTAIGYRALYKNGYGSYNNAMGAQALSKNTTGYKNNAFGFSALSNNTRGNYNTAIGDSSLFRNTIGYRNTSNGASSLKSNIDGIENTANGFSALYSNTNGSYNTAIGKYSLYKNISGSFNTAIGINTLLNNTIGFRNTALGVYSLSNNTSGNDNTATGDYALFGNTIGSKNTVNGFEALSTNTTGSYNTAIGADALLSNTTGYSNIAIGIATLYKNTLGSNLVAIGDSALFWNGLGATLPNHATKNTAVGSKVLFNNTSGYNNTANGNQALFNNTIGNRNTANGAFTLFNNTTGELNTAVGDSALFNSTIGGYNMAIGNNALFKNTIGFFNTAIGNNSLYGNINGSNNTASGYAALGYNTGNNNTAIGFGALSSNIDGNENTSIGYLANTATVNLTNTTVIGANAIVNASNKIRLGNSLVTIIEASGPYNNVSDARFKNNIKENIPGLAFINKLKPVSYHFDTQKYDEHQMQNMPDSAKQKRAKGMRYEASSNIIHSGFLAQDIEKICKELNYDFDGLHVPDVANKTDYYSLAYSQFVMPLVKGMQEQQVQIENYKKDNDSLKKQIDNFQKQIDELKSFLKK